MAFYAEGKADEEILELTRYSVSGARNVLERYQKYGLDGLKDSRHQNKGAPTVLTAEEKLLFSVALRRDFEDGIVWDGKKAQQWIKDNLGKDVYITRGYEAMHAAGFSYQKPRPSHTKANKEAQEEFKSKS